MASENGGKEDWHQNFCNELDELEREAVTIANDGRRRMALILQKWHDRLSRGGWGCGKRNGTHCAAFRQLGRFRLEGLVAGMVNIPRVHGTCVFIEQANACRRSKICIEQRNGAFTRRLYKVSATTPSDDASCFSVPLICLQETGALIAFILRLTKFPRFCPSLLLHFPRFSEENRLDFPLVGPFLTRTQQKSN